MTNSNDVANLPVKDQSKFQILNVSIESEDGSVYNIPLPMPYLYDKEEIPNLKIHGIQISEPRDIPGLERPDFQFGEIKNASEQIQEEDSGEKQAQD